VEDITKSLADTHKQIDAKMDGISKMLQQWNSSSEFGSQEKLSKTFPNPPSPQQITPIHMLTADEMAFLKRQEVVGKISLHQEPPHSSDIPHPDSSSAPNLTFDIPNINMNPHT
jgi:hypothetical protein